MNYRSGILVSCLLASIAALGYVLFYPGTRTESGQAVESPVEDQALVDLGIEPVSGTPKKKFPATRISGSSSAQLVAEAVSIETLKDRAKAGDAKAAYQLSMKLLQCASLDARYHDLQQKGDALESNPAVREAALEELAELDATYEKCREIAPEDVDDRFRWLEIAAEAGNTEAQVTYVATMGILLSDPKYALDENWIRSYKERSIKHLASAASRGSVSAMAGLAHTYWDGIITERNRVYAYAYMHAALQSGLLPSASQVLDIWARSMSEKEVDAATRLGVRIYSSCCS